ncbi:MAG: hypothetical protein LM582_10115 [Desulfurococcaceae archaeon]|nr:hypothetical protein [Desulfurococcaceae archaeon]
MENISSPKTKPQPDQSQVPVPFDLSQFIAKINPYNNLLDAMITNITATSGDSGSPLYYHVMPGGRSLATYILGHLSRGENCTLAIVNGELAYLCPRTIYVSAQAIRNIFGATICNVITGC